VVSVLARSTVAEPFALCSARAPCSCQMAAHGPVTRAVIRLPAPTTVATSILDGLAVDQHRDRAEVARGMRPRWARVARA
jgi:hypothetical protein